MCKNKDIVFSRGCVEKNPVCAVCPQPLHSCWSGCSPPWTQAGKCRQDLNRLWWRRVVGVPSSIPTPESVCLACSGGVMRVTKVLGYVCVGRRACVDLLCDWGDLSTTGLCQRLQELLELLGCWLCAPCKELSHHSSKSSLPPVCLGLAVQPGKWHVCGQGDLLDWCCVFRANPVHGTKY